uniref:Uncharacterized protein n=1 Tax=Triticum urartu TaxID=4572 RepID=A0A8R7PS87_TRIUA
MVQRNKSSTRNSKTILCMRTASKGAPFSPTTNNVELNISSRVIQSATKTCAPPWFLVGE